MASEAIAIDVSDDGIPAHRLDAEPVNAVVQATREGLADALDVLREERVGAVVVTGTDELFSVGADVGLFEEPHQVLPLAKRVTTAARDADGATAGLLGSLAQSTLLETDDQREGVYALREKCDPAFAGR